MTTRQTAVGRYSRHENEAERLDRNWSELVQELRVIAVGVQILFAFLLSIAFQARFARTSPFQRDIYLVTLAFSGTSTALLIAPAAMHRFLFHIGVKDELVTLTNRLAIAGLSALSVSMVGAVVLVADWVAGTEGAFVCGLGGAMLFGLGWFAFPMWLRRRYESLESTATSPTVANDGSQAREAVEEVG